MNKKTKTISLIILLPIIIILSFSIKNQTKADNDDSVEYQVSEMLNENIKTDDLIVISAEKDKNTFVYLDSNLRTIHIFDFVGNTMEYHSSISYDVWDTDEYDGDKFEWRYHEPNGGSTSLLWAISPTDGIVKVKGKSYEQENVKLENGLNVFFIKNKTTLDHPLEVELE
ncbi:hypothetical protein MHH33_08525 [Paenisporosarcina sp. FSL H8-0542]|uniref:hypothetical protein n=1 Tax=Paenisporosarcina sp. FSL H8-0542 TaxID=2921401 RepID=UPI00315A94CF